MYRQQIVRILQEHPGLKAKDIGKKIGADKSAINSTLYAHRDEFSKDEEHRWSLNVVKVVLAENSWVDGDSFEKSLKSAGCVISCACKSIVFVVTHDCKILLEATARLLALCNQLVYLGKTVTLDFSACGQTLSFFNRIGFLDLLVKEVQVLPSRPKNSAADRYRGNSEKVVEFGSINLANPDKDIPWLLKEQFVIHAGEAYSLAVFTIFSELFGNVCEHSNSPIPGFAALQKYEHPPHIQTIVSDSGDGIVGTLRPILDKHYPKLAAKYKPDDPKSDVLLLKEVLERGRITQSEETGRGLGLKTSQGYAVKFSADISVRQETFELKLSYRGGKLSRWGHVVGMPKIRGTHVCFDFFLDYPLQSG